MHKTIEEYFIREAGPHNMMEYVKQVTADDLVLRPRIILSKFARLAIIGLATYGAHRLFLHLGSEIAAVIALATFVGSIFAIEHKPSD